MILLDGALDYAGLFPPATLGMADAVRCYATYRVGADRALLGRFVVPVARLEELDVAARELAADDFEAPWELSVIGGGEPDADRQRIAAFEGRRERTSRSMSVRSVEQKVETAADVRDVVAGHRGGAGRPLRWSLYLESPRDGDGTTDVLAAIAAAGVFAKVRTGGITLDSFPSSEALAGFVVACSRAGVPLKATGGLHHAVRGDHRLDGPQSPCAAMHGFLNLFVGAVLLHGGKIGAEELAGVLEERTRGAFELERGAAGVVRWRDRGVGPEAIRRARTRLLHSFGTCSFEEPVEELRGMGALA